PRVPCRTLCWRLTSCGGVPRGVHRTWCLASAVDGPGTSWLHAPGALRDVCKPQGGLRQHSPKGLPSVNIQRVAVKARPLTESPPGSSQAARGSTPTFTETQYKRQQPKSRRKRANPHRQHTENF